MDQEDPFATMSICERVGTLLTHYLKNTTRWVLMESISVSCTALSGPYLASLGWLSQIRGVDEPSAGARKRQMMPGEGHLNLGDM